MVEAGLGHRRRKAVGKTAVAASRYPARGGPVCAGAYPPGRSPPAGDSRRACSCDRIGCPAPAAHPMTAACQIEASTDPGVVGGWWLAQPEANVVLATGRGFRVPDLTGRARLAATASLER